MKNIKLLAPLLLGTVYFADNSYTASADTKVTSFAADKKVPKENENSTQSAQVLANESVIKEDLTLVNDTNENAPVLDRDASNQFNNLFATIRKFNNTNDAQIKVLAQSAQSASITVSQTQNNNQTQLHVNDMQTVIDRSKGTGKVINLTLEPSVDFNNSSITPNIGQSGVIPLSQDDKIEDYLTILSTIYYSDAFENAFYEHPNKSVYQYVKDFLQLPAEDQKSMDTIAGGSAKTKAIFDTILANQKVYDNIILVDVDHSESAGAATAKILNDGYAYKLTFLYGDDMIIYYAGTAGDLEWANNAKGITDSDTSSQENALKYFDQQYNRYGKNREVYIVGVSNGGNKATYVGLLRGDKIQHSYSFGGPGFSDAFVNKYSEQIEKYSSKMTTLSSDEDFIHILYPNQVAKAEYHKGQAGWVGSDFISIIMNRILGTHIPSGLLKIQPDGTVAISQSSVENPLPELVSDFVSYAERNLPESDVRALANQIQALFIQYPNAYFSDVFSTSSFILDLLTPNVMNVIVNRVEYWLPKWVSVLGVAGEYALTKNAQLNIPQIVAFIQGFLHMPLPTGENFISQNFKDITGPNLANFVGQPMANIMYSGLWQVLTSAGAIAIFAIVYLSSIGMKAL